VDAAANAIANANADAGAGAEAEAEGFSVSSRSRASIVVLAWASPFVATRGSWQNAGRRTLTPNGAFVHQPDVSVKHPIRIVTCDRNLHPCWAETCL